MRIGKSFFERDAVTVAKDLLGRFFVRTTKEGRVVGRIVETEAYGDAADLASHARFGPTPRSRIMFGPPGVLYVYKIYGIFNLANIVCGQEGRAGAVLIRAAEIIEGESIARRNINRGKFAKAGSKLAAGPGKFSLALGLTTENNGVDLLSASDLYLERPHKKLDFDIMETARVGVDYAQQSKNLPWRFYVKDSPFVSKR